MVGSRSGIGNRRNERPAVNIQHLVVRDSIYTISEQVCPLDPQYIVDRSTGPTQNVVDFVLAERKGRRNAIGGLLISSIETSKLE